MAEKLIKPWNAQPAGAAVSTDPQDLGAVLVGEARMAHLKAEGFLGPDRVIRIEKESA